MYEKRLKIIYDLFSNLYGDFEEFPVGGNSDFFIGRNLKNYEKVVLKVINKSENTNPKNELIISRKFNHKNVIKIYDSGYFKNNENESSFLIEKYYECDLTGIIEELSLSDTFFAMINILEGVYEIHKHSIIHRDLKPDNFLVEENKNVVISDFGNSTFIDDLASAKTQKGIGTYAYMAPECWTNDNNNFGIDIYALGICFYELITKQLPYISSIGSSDDWKKIQFSQNIPKIDSVPNSLNSLLHDMTNKNWKERPCVQNVINRFKNILKIDYNLEFK